MSMLPRSRACQRRKERSLACTIDAPDTMVRRIKQVDAPAWIHGNHTRLVDRCVERGTAIWTMARFTGAGHRHNPSVRENHTDTVIARVGDVEAAIFADDDARGPGKSGGASRSIVARKPRPSSAGHRRQNARPVNLADPAVELLGGIYVAFAVYSDSFRI